MIFLFKEWLSFLGLMRIGLQGVASSSGQARFVAYLEMGNTGNHMRVGGGYLFCFGEIWS